MTFFSNQNIVVGSEISAHVSANMAELCLAALKPSELHVCDEMEADISARENLLDQVFGAARSEKTSERLREGRLPAQGLSLVAKDRDDRLVGTVRLWHIRAGEAEALLLGPLAVASAHRGQGLGRKLICESLFRALWLGHKAVLLVGDAPYYAGFGFDKKYTRKLIMPGPVEAGRFLGLELRDGALAQAEGLVMACGALDLAAYRAGAAQRQAA